MAAAEWGNDVSEGAPPPADAPVDVAPPGIEAARRKGFARGVSWPSLPQGIRQKGSSVIRAVTPERWRLPPYASAVPRTPRDAEPAASAWRLFSALPRTPWSSASCTTKRPSTTRQSEMFEASVQVQGQKLGLDINWHDGRTLLVSKTNEGPVAAYDRAAPREVVIAVGDRLVEVNGAAGDAQALIEAAKAVPTMKALVKRSEEKRIHLVRAPGGAEHGLQVLNYDVLCLVLSAEPEAGSLLAQHNETDSFYRMKKDDYIMEVNGIRGCPDRLREALQTGNSWDIGFRRIVRKAVSKRRDEVLWLWI